MLLSGLVSDRTFISQTEESFEAVFAPKKGAFEALESAVPNIEDMEFLITFSSVATFGNAGQTNYSRYMILLFSFLFCKRQAESDFPPSVQTL